MHRACAREDYDAYDTCRTVLRYRRPITCTYHTAAASCRACDACIGQPAMTAENPAAMMSQWPARSRALGAAPVAQACTRWNSRLSAGRHGRLESGPCILCCVRAAARRMGVKRIRKAEGVGALASMAAGGGVRKCAAVDAGGLPAELSRARCPLHRAPRMG